MPPGHPGGAAQGKQRFDMPIEGANNFAESRRVVDPSTFTGEGGRLSRFMNRIPGMNAIAGMHDVFQVRLDLLGGDRFGSVLRSTLNFPGDAGRRGPDLPGAVRRRAVRGRGDGRLRQARMRIRSCSCC